MSCKNNNHTSTPPAEGERRAIRGYSGQYRVSAWIILRHLRRETLEWIHLADPNAGRVDDLQLGSPNRIDAYQVKWSQFAGNFSFSDLTKTSSSSPNIIEQLSDGWVSLKKNNKGSRVVVHFITNDRPSKNDSLPAGRNPPSQNNFAAFLAQVWHVAREVEYPSKGVPDVWKDAWEAIRKASSLNDVEFDMFVKDCELELDYRLPIFSDCSRETTYTRQDLQDIEHILFDTVADPARIVKLTKDQLLTRLDWQERVGFKSRHEFPVDEYLYRPITATVQQLGQAIETLTGGYIALLGSPGSGKSTLLTQTLRYRQSERVIRYYAYVPDSPDPIRVRGESENFLHDVVLAIEQAGFRVGESLSRLDRHQLLDRLHKQLDELHKDWQEKGRKTVILIDGLDHIEREQHPQRSLLLDLPDLEQIPDGVYIIFGSQTDDLSLPSSVHYAIQQGNRRIDIEPLKKQVVFDIVEKTGLQINVTSAHKERIFEVCGGHPLALRLLLNRFQEVTSQDDLEQILKKADEFTGNIELYYHGYWRQIESNGQLAHLFGLLARVRGLIDLQFFENQYGRLVIQQLRSTAYQFFRREDINRWYFFHNSFRIFIINKTREIPPDGYDPSKDIVFHHELAEQYAQSPEYSPLRWEELYHRIAAKEHDVVLQCATQAWFRGQFFAYRPIAAIKTDIQLSLQSALANKDVAAFCKLIFAGAEFSKRADSLDSNVLPSIFLDIGDYRLAFEHIRAGNILRVSVHSALELSHKLCLAGRIDEARRVFELAEPLDMLSGSQEVGKYQREDDALLVAWAETAANFRDIDNIITAIRHVRVSSDERRDEDPERRTRNLQNSLLLQCGLALLDEKRWDELLRLITEFDVQNQHDQQYWLSLHVHSWRECAAGGDYERARQFLQTVLRRVSELHLEDPPFLAIAEAIFCILGDKEKAQSWFVKTPEPIFKIENFHLESGIRPFMKRFRYARLIYLFGDSREPQLLVPDAADPRHQGIVFFERSLCVIAKIWADAWKKVQHTPSEIDRRIFPLLRLFNREQPDRQFWSLWSTISSLRSEFYSLLVEAVTEHGSEAIDKLRTAFEREWQGEETGKYWPVNVRRDIILRLYHVGVDKSWSVQHLADIEQTMLEGKNIQDCIEECKEQVHAWIAVKDVEAAKRNIKKLMHVTFGVSDEDDYQLDSWIEWLKLINKQEPEEAIKRIVWFARAIVSLEEHVAGGATNSAACNLLEAAFAHSPRGCVRLLDWFFAKHITNYCDTLFSILKAALRFSEPPIQHIRYVFCDLMLPYIGNQHIKPFEELFECVVANCNTDAVVEIAQHVLSKINVYALPEIRQPLRNAVADIWKRRGLNFSLVGLRPEDLVAKPRSSGSSEKITLNDGTELSFSEAEKRASTSAGLIELLKKTADDSYFHWDEMVEKVADDLSQEDVRNLVKLFGEKNRNSQVYAILSKRLSALDATEEAWGLGEKALETSRPYGWGIMYDGGTRLTAFEALKRADSNRTHRIAFKTLVSDLTGEFKHPERVALHSHRILPLITDEVPLMQVWDTVQEHARTLLDKIPLIDDTPDIEYDMTLDTPKHALIDLLFQSLNHPVNVIAQSSQRTFANLLLENDEATQDAFIDSLKTEYNDLHEPLIIVLEAVSNINANALKPFEEVVLKLYTSPSYVARRASQHICERVGWKKPEPQSNRIELPPVYTLYFSTHGTGRLIDESQISSTEPIPDSDNPEETVIPFKDIYADVAREADIALTNICYRAVQIMSELSPPECWSAEGERKLRIYLESAGLRMSFTRPRADIARRALFHVISELFDAGKLDYKSLARLEKRLRFYDPSMLLIEPVMRPPFISSIQSRQSERGNNNEWCAEITEVTSAMATRSDDGNIIIGEYTEFTCLENGMPTEIRGQVVTQESEIDINFEEIPQSMFKKSPQLIKEEYSSARSGNTRAPIIIYNNAFTYETLAAKWLALNPGVGDKLGWQLVNDGLFRWVDTEGRLMAETIWWNDGLFQQRSPFLFNTLGEGWLVVASELGWQVIRERFNKLKRFKFAKREYHQEQQKFQRCDSFKENL